MKLSWDGFLRSCENDFLRVRSQEREERRALPWASPLSLSLLICKNGNHHSACLMGGCEDKGGSHLWKLQNYLQVAGALKLTVERGGT